MLPHRYFIFKPLPVYLLLLIAIEVVILLRLLVVETLAPGERIPIILRIQIGLILGPALIFIAVERLRRGNGSILPPLNWHVFIFSFLIRR